MANHPRSSMPTPAAIPTVVPRKPPYSLASSNLTNPAPVAALPYLVLALIPIPMMGFVFAGMGGLPTVPPALATPAPAAAEAQPPLLAPLSAPACRPSCVPPTEPLQPIEEAVAAPEWYAITCGHFVGVVDQFALSAMAISGVAHAARKAYTTQALALTAFNQALTWGGVQVA
ncbi:hypothetical protein C8R43DRAFT_1140602 [Mycena crocata]|nr:hypothetical protein C8R43DRAFT_1140602 [Mycena crocata]